jgi:hypothetical protein
MQGQGGAVGIGDGRDDGEARSEAVAVGAPLVAEALEGLKEPVDLVAGNGRAGVGDPEQDPARLPGGEYLDVSTWPVAVLRS